MSNSSEGSLNQQAKCSCQGGTLDKLLQPQILTILASQNLHGYRIIHELEIRKMIHGDKIDRTGVYRTLKHLEEKNLIAAEWDVNGTGAAKKIYRINPSGQTCLKNWIETLETYQNTIAGILSEARRTIDPSSK
ncbi:MAG: hypothetical protein PWP56_1111 [Acetobacterium sp.]|nr:hypothetical protein [Acetobacterium sp.]